DVKVVELEEGGDVINSRPLCGERREIIVERRVNRQFGNIDVAEIDLARLIFLIPVVYSAIRPDQIRQDLIPVAAGKLAVGIIAFECVGEFLNQIESDAASLVESPRELTVSLANATLISVKCRNRHANFYVGGDAVRWRCEILLDNELQV